MKAFSATTPAQLASILRGKRREDGLTQKQAGDKVGLLPKTISALESDPSRSSVESLYKLLSALEIELALQPKSQPHSSPSEPEW